MRASLEEHLKREKRDRGREVQEGNHRFFSQMYSFVTEEAAIVILVAEEAKGGGKGFRDTKS